MCTPFFGKIEKSSLPSRTQLNMHVNADEFIIRMHRGRFRTESASSEADSNETIAGGSNARDRSGKKTQIKGNIKRGRNRLRHWGKPPTPAGETTDHKPGEENLLDDDKDSD